MFTYTNLGKVVCSLVEVIVPVFTYTNLGEIVCSLMEAILPVFTYTNLGEEGGLLCFAKRRKPAKYGHWKRRPDSLVLTCPGELLGNKRRGGRKMGGIVKIKHWTDNGLEVATELARRRLRPN